VNRKRTNPGEDETGMHPFQVADIPQVADIHIKTLEEDLVANLGRRFLERALYPTMLHPASTGFGFVQVRNGNVAGFVVGMLNPAAFYRTLVLTRWHECLLATVRKCLQGWEDFLQVTRRVRHLLSGRSRGTGGELFTLAIDSAYQGRGMGVRLTQAFLDHCSSHGMSRCWVSTKSDNLPARRICEHLGFREERAFTLDEGPAVAYRLDLGTLDGAEQEGMSKPMAVRRQGES
jgi:ribosomal protein S18 acetylase RimI-like enzyme